MLQAETQTDFILDRPPSPLFMPAKASSQKKPVLFMYTSCCIVLYCIVLYCIVLYCIVLYCIVSYCIVSYCIVLYGIVLYCIVLYCIVLYYIMLNVLSMSIFICLVIMCSQIGIDIETQIEEGELFDFDTECEPVLEAT